MPGRPRFVSKMYHRTGRVGLTELLPERLKLVKVRLVLLLVLNLLLDTLEDPDCSRVVIDTAGSADGRLDDRGGGDEIVREAVVEAALDFEKVLGRLEEVDVTLVERLERLLSVCAGRRAGESGGDAGRGGAGAQESGSELSADHRGGGGGGGAGEPCGEVVVVKKGGRASSSEGTTRRDSAEASAITPAGSVRPALTPSSLSSTSPPWGSCTNILSASILRPRELFATS